MTTPQNQENEPTAPPTADIDFQMFARHYMQEQQAHVDRAKTLLRNNIIPQLIQHAVANVEVAYSGYGDSGAIEEIQFRDADGQRVVREQIPTTLVDELENCVYSFLPAGFEINDGGQGTLTIDTRTAKVVIQHQENYTETRDSTQEISL